MAVVFPLPGQTWNAVLNVDGEGLYGDLTVQGFPSAVSARELGGKFAEAIREWKPGVTVDITVSRGPSYLGVGEPK